MDKLNIIVFGASGDLAAKKIFPALFSLYSRRLLPEQVNFYGFSRSAFTDEEFRDRITATLTCRYTPDHSCEKFMHDFLARCFYCRGDYNDSAAYEQLEQLMCGKDNEDDHTALLFYLAVPPTLYVDIATAMKAAGLVHENDLPHWSRVIIEKPFGRDRESSDQLTKQLGTLFSENNTYRIDHYLGKEMVQNLLVLRFANQIFQPLWNRAYIQRVELIWSEDLGINERGGYFDHYGIIRDVIQNHLMQIIALLAMEEPLSLSAKDVRDRKVELLRAIAPVKPDELVVGQYASAMFNGVRVSGYLDDPSVPNDSITPTFARMTLYIDNERWRGVPFHITAGKGLSSKKTEVKIVFKHVGSNIFCNLDRCPPLNELIFRIQPSEGLHFNIITKRPGTKIDFTTKEIDLSYQNAFAGEVIPEAYENLILDAVNGNKQLFIREDELQAAWDILTPALHHLEQQKIVPKPYKFGSNGV
ncbi:MAG: glucose-6-phosphate dehydrogenase [Victivallaceae bacterium]|nr:glucose-6-phosphate dehydrogenase [Victivallaceae bacterium]